MWENFYRAEAFVYMRKRSKTAEAKGNLGEVRQENIKVKNACEN